VAVFGFSDDAADVVSFRKAIFRMILSRAKKHLTDPADIKELDVSEATDGISFELLDDAERARLLEAVYQGTRELRQQVADGRPTEEPVREGAVEKLDEILSLLSRFR
jgi:hypothetical protein